MEKIRSASVLNKNAVRVIKRQISNKLWDVQQTCSHFPHYIIRLPKQARSTTTRWASQTQQKLQHNWPMPCSRGTRANGSSLNQCGCKHHGYGLPSPAILKELMTSAERCFRAFNTAGTFFRGNAICVLCTDPLCALVRSYHIIVATLEMGEGNRKSSWPEMNQEYNQEILWRKWRSSAIQTSPGRVLNNKQREWLGMPLRRKCTPHPPGIYWLTAV